jgi:hypothetical protein
VYGRGGVGIRACVVNPPDGARGRESASRGVAQNRPRRTLVGNHAGLARRYVLRRRAEALVKGQLGGNDGRRLPGDALIELEQEHRPPVRKAGG